MTSKIELQQYINQQVDVAFRFDVPYSRRQRTFDLVVSLASLFVALPVLAAASLAIWLEDRGSPIFSQKRVGQFGRLFTIYKLRTMRLSACGDARSPNGKNDSRLTRVGSFLRRTSIDELPQLFNVIRGDMSVVGPRPEMPFVVSMYERWQHCRHLHKPGITGLWQISVRKMIPLHHPDATKIDLHYIRIASTRCDALIFCRTFLALFKMRGAF